MKKIFSMLAVLAVIGVCLVGCGSNDYDYDTNDDYDYDKGYGYTEPEPGESLSDYIKRQDPDLYDSMQDRWNSLR